MVDMTLPRQKRLWPFFLVLISKTFLLGFCSSALAAYAPDSYLWTTLYKLLDFAVGLGVYFLFVYVWEGEPLHILLIFIISEAITMVLQGVIIGINMLEGRKDKMEIIGPFMAADLLIPMISVAVFYLLKPQLKRLARFFGNLFLPFRLLLWIVVIAQFLGTRASALLYSNTGTQAVTAVMVQGSIQLILLAVILLQLVSHQFRIQRTEEMFQDMQMRLLRQRALLTQKKRSELIENRTLIKKQMLTIEKKIGEGTRIGQEELRKYIDELQQMEAWKYRGIYCQDVLVDEILAQIRDANNARGNKINIVVHGYQRGTVAEEDVARMIYCLAFPEEGRTSSKKRRWNDKTLTSGSGARDSKLSLAGTERQLAIRYETSNMYYSRSRITAMQSMVRKYHGEIVFEGNAEQESKNAYVMLRNDV